MIRWNNLTQRKKTMLATGLLIIAVAGGVFCKFAYHRYQLTSKITESLKSKGYRVLKVRRPLYREETGPFSGLIWYEYTFTNQDSLKASYHYQKIHGNAKKRLTLTNSPIVYRVVLEPPTAKVKQWSAVIYLDTNQRLKDSERSEDVLSLNIKSLRTLSVK